MKHAHSIGPIAHQPAGFDSVAIGMGRGDPVARSESGKLDALQARQMGTSCSESVRERSSLTLWIHPSFAVVAVGTCVSSRAPRTEPYVRLSRIRLPPWVCDGEAIARPRMKDDRFREPGLRPLRHPYPRDAILVAATPQRAPPEVDDMVPEHGQCTGVGRHCVIAEVATNDVPQPFPLIGEGLVHALPQLLFDHPQLRPHAISPGLPFDLE